MQYWLLKSEPSTYSWETMVKDVVTPWDGVKNHQAQKYMKSMKLGDQAFFYHSVSEKAIQGIVEICKEYYYADDPKFGMMDVKFVKSLSNKVTLSDIKSNSLLQNMPVVKQSRLSVSPVTESEWNEIINMSSDE
ncbi:unnamed protein product [Phyllotreta striolata]|uniref:Thymocyte nuclear protein 1 n=1 Tax=Phyllotreta striolata TaxID=444603 RepID=A0A9N9TJ10_PHYSR|nr:unnamed protein product [Phyllotreta striolata]